MNIKYIINIGLVVNLQYVFVICASFYVNDASVTNMTPKATTVYDGYV